MFTLSFKTDNAAFDADGAQYESAWILRGIADKVEQGHKSGIIRDSNGNPVGEWESSQ